MTMEGQDPPGADWSKEADRLQKQLFAVIDFVFSREQAGLMSKEEGTQVHAAFNKVVIHDGGMHGLDTTAIGVALGRQGLHAMLQKLRELHPEWEADIAKLEPPSRRR